VKPVKYLTGAFSYTIGYDANGLMSSRTKTGQATPWSFTWTRSNMVKWVFDGLDGSEYEYDGSDARIKEVRKENGLEKEKKIFCPGFEQFFDKDASGNWKAKLIRVHIAAPDGVAGVFEYMPNQTSLTSGQSLSLLFTDHLGSVDLAINISGGASLSFLAESTRTKYSYDPWGERRNETTWVGAHVLTTTELAAQHTDRGFTGHEMLDELGLINMNARIYDPQLGRFLSADSIVQNAGDLQSYNRYSYCGNNPLSRIDPSGHSWLSSAFKGIGNFVSKYWKTIVVVVIMIVAACFLGPLVAGWLGVLQTTSPVLYAAICGAVGGFAGGFSSTLIYGGSIGDAFKNGFKGGIIGALTAVAMYQIDVYAPDWFKGKIPGKNEKWFTPERIEQQLKRIAARATVNGASSELNGGSFKDGFSSSALWDCVKCSTEVIMEWRYRWECKNKPGKVFDATRLASLSNKWNTASDDPKPKLENEAVDAGYRPNVGTPPKSSDLIKLSAWDTGDFWMAENGPIMSSLSYYVPGMNNLGLLHDFWAALIHISSENMFIKCINRAASIGTIPPFMILNYAILTNMTLNDYGAREYVH
jgi:RHS repeat-associated protein